VSRFWDRVTGTRRPGAGTAVLHTLALREALLALDGVRYGSPQEGGDLVAEHRVPELRLRIRIQMRLVPGKREVRALDERWEPASEGTGMQYARGPFISVQRQFEFQRGPDGRRRRVETFRFDSRDIKDPLRDTVVAAGWTWRGVLRKP
jgi:hypothetical protein